MYCHDSLGILSQKTSKMRVRHRVTFCNYTLFSLISYYDDDDGNLFHDIHNQSTARAMTCFIISKSEITNCTYDLLSPKEERGRKLPSNIQANNCFQGFLKISI
jgi:hypothetical protein